MSTQLRAAVLGAGWYAAQNHIPALAARREVALDGVCRLGAVELAQVRDHFGFAFASEDAMAVLARRPDIVVVSTPHHLHYGMARAALENGAHVLCEKPMTLDAGEAWDLVCAAERAQRHLLVANGYHYLPHVDTLRQRLAAGAVGRIEQVTASFVSATRAVFHGEQGPDQWRTTFFRPARSTWQDPDRGGGFAYGQMSHCLALLYFLTDLVPLTVSAHTFGEGDVDLANAGAIRLRGGAVASVSGAATLPEGNRALMRFIISGSDGVLVAEFDRDSAEIRRNDGTVERLELAAGDWTYRCDGPVDALVDLALGRGTNLSPGRFGAEATATIAAMLASAHAGGAPVDVVRPEERNTR